jgi:hypothetical protein
MKKKRDEDLIFNSVLTLLLTNVKNKELCLFKRE